MSELKRRSVLFVKEMNVRSIRAANRLDGKKVGKASVFQR